MSFIKNIKKLNTHLKIICHFIKNMSMTNIYFKTKNVGCHLL